MSKIDRTINIKIKGIYLDKDNRKAGVQFEANVTTLRIEFDEGWDNYAKTITFWDALLGNPVKRILTADLLEDIKVNTRLYLVPIPGEAMGEAGDMTFIIDGYIDGKRKRSLSDTLWVEKAPYEENAEEPTDPTPSQAEQLQVQIDTLLSDMQEQANIAYDKAGWAEYYAGQAESFYDGAVEVNNRVQSGAEKSAQAVSEADEAALLAQSWASGGTGARTDEATNNAKYWSDKAKQIAGGEFATPSEAKGYADNALIQAKQYADNTTVAKDGTRAMTGDLNIDKAIPAARLLIDGVLRSLLMKNANGTSDFGTVLRDINGSNKIDLLLSATEKALKVAIDGVEYPVYTGNNLTAATLGAVKKSGDEMTGALVFDNPAVFSAIAKKRNVGDKKYLLRLGLGSEGSGAVVSLRLIEVNASGTETVLTQFDLDTSGVYWTLGNSKKTIAHSGNIGLLTAAVE